MTPDRRSCPIPPPALFGALALFGCSPDPHIAPSEAGPTFVGLEACTECHADQADAWAGSHHDLAMQPATDATVLGDFENASLEHSGSVTSFHRSEGGFEVETQGADGQVGRFRVAYTFGVQPLQQYLIEQPGGRLQAFTVAWDSRAADEGGQRWFRLYPDEDTPTGDVLHWTGPANNWNYMCAECHSTGLEKGYDPAADAYTTTWSDEDVSCEACHGPGSLHVAWAEERQAEGAPPLEQDGAEDAYGLTARLADQSGGTWVMDAETGIARRTALPDDAQIETCGRCHSRRASLAPEAPPGGPLMDTHLPSTLAEGLYYADGQILDEVYVYGSFLQSAMYAAGVRCSDCHEPHSGRLRSPGNAACATCHAPTRFDTPEHHFHDAGTDGARCVSCHMPARTYMVIDPRRDHSFRVPRPDLSDEIGAPDACTGCHTDRSSDWAARTVAEWYGAGRQTERHYGQAIAAGRAGAPGAEAALGELATDESIPGIVRATAMELLAASPGASTAAVLPDALADPDPLVRVAGLRASAAIPPRNRLQLVGRLLSDPIRAVRVEAARHLAAVPPGTVPPVQAAMLERATDEYLTTLEATNDHPSSYTSRARFHADQGRMGAAEVDLRTAVETAPWYVPARVNLADLLRSQNRDDEGETLLRDGLAVLPDAARLHYALGLLLARTDRSDEATEELRIAAELDPADPRLSYAYAIALNSDGETNEALEVLARTLERDPYDRDVLAGLATITRDAGRIREALEYARRLAELEPDDPGVARLVQELEAGR